jgi:hypothetical protein
MTTTTHTDEGLRAAVEANMRNVFAKLDLIPDDEQHRRVLAVLAYLRG